MPVLALRVHARRGVHGPDYACACAPARLSVVSTYLCTCKAGNRNFPFEKNSKSFGCWTFRIGGGQNAHLDTIMPIVLICVLDACVCENA